jgi:hypothetical protein
MRFKAPFLLAPLLLASCAQPFEGRVATRLHEAGLSRSMADCMARKWVKKLNVFQLRRISGLADSLKSEDGRLTIGRFITRVRRLDDPEIVHVVTKSSLVCALTA